MRNILAAMILALFTAAGAAAQDARPRAIDLDVPGAIERLERSDPAHFETIREIMTGLFNHADKDVPRWLQVSFNAQDVSYAPVLLTSDPPRRRLSFALDGTRYVAVVTLSHLHGVVVPAEKRR